MKKSVATFVCALPRHLATRHPEALHHLLLAHGATALRVRGPPVPTALDPTRRSRASRLGCRPVVAVTATSRAGAFPRSVPGLAAGRLARSRAFISLPGCAEGFSRGDKQNGALLIQPSDPRPACRTVHAAPAERRTFLRNLAGSCRNEPPSVMGPQTGHSSRNRSRISSPPQTPQGPDAGNSGARNRLSHSGPPEALSKEWKHHGPFSMHRKCAVAAQTVLHAVAGRIPTRAAAARIVLRLKYTRRIRTRSILGRLRTAARTTELSTPCA